MSRVLDAMMEVIEAITDEFADPPSVSELMEVIGLALSTSDNRLYFLPSGIVTVSPDGEPRQSADSRVDELNDNAFVLSADMIAMILETHAEAGRPLTAVSLSKLLTELLSRVPEGLLKDSAPHEQTVKVLGSPVRQRPELGDLVAIPSASGGCYQAVILARNRFGTAFGFFTGRHESARIPEIYHFMGVAETADGLLRQVPDHELALVGVTDGSYLQGYLGSHLEHVLDADRLVG